MIEPVSDVELSDSLEQSVIAHCLLPGVYALYDTFEVSVTDFRRDVHQRIWKAIVALAYDGHEVDAVSVRLQLIQSGDMVEVTESYYNHLPIGAVRPDPANIAWIVGQLKDQGLARHATYATQRFQQQLKTSSAIADGALVQHLDELHALVEDRARVGQAAPWLDADGQLAAHKRDTAINQGYGVSFGLDALDEVTGGVRAGEVCGLLARPGVGKTVFCCHIARAAAQRVGVVVFSLEMPASQIVGRLKQMLYGVSRYQLEREMRIAELQFDGTDPDDRYRDAFRQLVIVDTPGLSVREMHRRVRQIRSGPLKEVPIRLVIIDHLGLVGGDRGLSTYDRVSAQARDVKDMAKRLEAAVLLAVQVSREAGGDGERELGLGSARDSGVVEEAMDYMLGVRRLDRATSLPQADRDRFFNVLFVKVIKHRHGDPPGHEFPYRFNPVGLGLTFDETARSGTDDLREIAQRGGGRRR